MFMVGPRTTCAPLAFASKASNRPALDIRSTSQVEANPVPQGRHAPGVPLKNRVPRIPFGPSESRSDGIPSRGMGTVCQKSRPRDLFSVCSKVISEEGKRGEEGLRSGLVHTCR